LLLELRDYLNGQADPATGASIAFSTMVIRDAPEARKAKADAERAYPEWIPMARALRRTMFALQIGSLIITGVVAVLAAYAYVGSSLLANVVDLTAKWKSLDADILAHEESAPNRNEGRVVRYCDNIVRVPAPSNPGSPASSESTTNPGNTGPLVDQFINPTQEHLCDERRDLSTKIDLAYQSLLAWLFQPDDRRTGAWLEVLKGYALPVLMGLLGSMAYVLRRYLRSLGDRVLNPRDLREYMVRIVLGTVCGVVIGFFTSSGSDAGQAGIPSISLTAPALAFLAGYAVEVVFRMLDGLSEQIFAARK
jgi:hypothetical protein